MSHPTRPRHRSLHRTLHRSLLGALVAVAAACSTSPAVTTERAEPAGGSTPATEPAGTAPTEPPGSEPSATEPDGTEPPDTEPPDPEPAPADPAGTLEWGACPDGTGVGGAPLECAELAAPLDHAAPDGEQITIAIARVRASGSADERIGSLVFNPGGPGGSGIEFLGFAVFAIPEEVARRFDLVSFDPRGVGASSAVDCDIELDDNVDLLEPGDDETWTELVEEAMALASETVCPADAQDLAPYVGTNNAARDLDMIRAALGDEGLSYVGYSYGTRLGATYAELFPDNVRALVLDAAVKPTTDFEELEREQAAGFDGALENFAAACDADPDCLLQELGPTLDVLAALREEIAAAGSFPTDDPDRVLTPGELDLGVVAALYSKQSWPILAEALYVADTTGDGTLLQLLGDSLVGRKPDGTYDNSQEANRFINCADEAVRLAVDEVRASVEAGAAQTEYFDDLFRAGTGCLGTPDPIDPLIIGPATGAPPILVIGNTGDPATPYGWSVALADFLDSGVLFTVEAEGHTAYTSIECVEPVVNAYLIDLDVPDPGASCSDNASTDFFPPTGEDQIGQIIAFIDCLRDNGVDLPEVGTADVLADPTLDDIFGEFDPLDPALQAALPNCLELLPEL